MRGKLYIILFLSNIILFSIEDFAKPPQETPQYIIHVIKFGETLSKISREYGVSVTDILNVNPSLAEINNLSPDQIIRIPNKEKKLLITPSNTTTNEIQPKAFYKSELVPKNGLHTVVKGQTLYNISKMYHVNMEDLKKWNNLPDNNVKIGGQLIVFPNSNPDLKPDTGIPPDIAPVKTIEKPTQVTDNEIVNTDDIEKPDIQASDNESQKELGKLFRTKALSGNIQSVKGTGAPMTTTLGSMDKTYFAMHKTLSIGTVIKIKNLVNSKVVYAKVIGKLPETDENKHVIVRYTLGVKKDLQLQNGKCYMQIEYPE